MINIGNYYRPQTIDEVYEILATKNPTKILAGGTDLILDLYKKENPVDVVDIGDIPQLRFIEEDNEKIRFGSMVTFTEIENSEVILKNYYALAEAASLVGSPQIRNQGTPVGNIINASPAADSVPALVAMDGEILIGSKEGQRWEKITDVLKGINQTTLAPDEVILEVSLKKIARLRSSFAKLGRRNALAISRISCAAGIVTDNQNIITDARVAFGAVAPNPFRSTLTENALLNKKFEQAIIEDALEAAHLDVAERLGSRSSAPYKREAIKGVVRQALESILNK